MLMFYNAQFPKQHARQELPQQCRVQQREHSYNQYIEPFRQLQSYLQEGHTALTSRYNTVYRQHIRDGSKNQKLPLVYSRQHLLLRLLLPSALLLFWHYYRRTTEQHSHPSLIYGPRHQGS